METHTNTFARHSRLRHHICTLWLDPTDCLMPLNNCSFQIHLATLKQQRRINYSHQTCVNRNELSTRLYWSSTCFWCKVEESLAFNNSRTAKQTPKQLDAWRDRTKCWVKTWDSSCYPDCSWASYFYWTECSWGMMLDYFCLWRFVWLVPLTVPTWPSSPSLHLPSGCQWKGSNVWDWNEPHPITEFPEIVRF